MTAEMAEPEAYGRGAWGEAPREANDAEA